MTAQNSPKPPIPRWAWIFAAACFVIPVFTIGGAIPTAIGVFSGLGVLGIARKTGRTTKKKVIYCGVVTGSAWTVFLVFLVALTALQAKHPKLIQPATQALKSKFSPQEKSEPKPTMAAYSPAETKSQPQEDEWTLEDLQKIYRKAVSMRYHIDVAKEQRAKMKAKGFDVTGRDEMITRLKQREQDHFEFVMNFYKIDREDLEAIIAEGDRLNWPTR